MSGVKLTTKQREWLERLRDGGPQRNGSRGTVAYRCRKMGLTEWMVQRRDEVVPLSWVSRDYPTLPEMWAAGWHYAPGDVESITDLGRSTLQQEEKG